MKNKIQDQLRDVIKNIRTKSYPISDIIPLLKEAADALDGYEKRINALETELESSRADVFYWRERAPWPMKLFKIWSK